VQVVLIYFFMNAWIRKGGERGRKREALLVE
jgi:hypothetical protein